MVQQRLSGDVVSRISNRIGADPGTTGNAIDAALPLLISALARNAQDPAQARSLARCTSAVMIGIARTVCAITMAVGVNSTEREPSGPDRESAR